MSAWFPKVWGVYNDEGQLVLEPDSISVFDFRKDRRVADYPIEEGGFATYNKVALPFEPRLTMTKSGTDEDKAAFIAELDALVDGLDLVTIVTPEATYNLVNFTGYDFHRSSSSGVQLVRFEITFQEVRIIEAGAFSKTADTSGETPKNGGTVSSAPANGGKAGATNAKPAEKAAEQKLNMIGVVDEIVPIRNVDPISTVPGNIG